jgi:hypothetical protein
MQELWRRVMSGGYIRTYELREVEQLGALILARLNAEDTPAKDAHGPWVASRVVYPLRSLLIKSGYNSLAYLVASLIALGGGFATSGIAVAAGASKGTASAWVIFGIGLLVALAGGLSQRFRFGFRSSERLTLASALREESWHFVYRTGGYSDPIASAFQAFQAKVDELHRRIDQVTTLESQPDGSDAPSTKGE